ncbi:MAG: putative toxin Y4kP [Nitrospinaceae bacterium]|nr:MAG: putative toxin Y4kP [Nitrospinaceae bacterium]
MMEVVWLEEAAKDLKEIGRHIAKDDPTAAYRVLTKIKASAESLENNPELGRTGRVAKTRELVISGYPYILPYTIKKKQICILAVMHTSRKWPDGF